VFAYWREVDDALGIRTIRGMIPPECSEKKDGKDNLK